MIETMQIKILFLAILLLGSLSMKSQNTTGISAGLFTPCASSPNCLSTQSALAKKHTGPLAYDSSRQVAIAKLMYAISNMKGSKLVAEDNNGYFHFEFKTPLGGFIDDVEFYFPEDEPLIHMKSSSRKGYWDFGANKRRLKRVRKRFLAAT